MYAPSRSEVTASRGIITVCPTGYAIDKSLELMMAAEGECEMMFDPGQNERPTPQHGTGQEKP